LRIDYKINDKFDFGIFFTSLILCGIGLVAIYSSTLNNPHAAGNFQKQVIWGIGAYIIFFAVYSLPTNIFKSISIPSYIISILLLMAVLAVGKRVNGAKSWFGFAGLGFQPSELANITTVMAMSVFLSRKNIDINSFKNILIALAIGLIPVVFILLEPNLGSTFIYFAIIIALLYWRGISLFGLFVVLSPGIVAIASLFGFSYFIIFLALVLISLILFKQDLFFSGSIFAINIAAGFFTEYVFKALKPHQQLRILSFMNPSSDPLGAGYNAIQAKIGIGSGGLLGKGFLSGSQTQLQFIPEQWTDFIFCVIGEEFGFIGSVITIILFFYMFYRIFKLASFAKDEFSSLLLIGILTVLFMHFLINVGMVVGILPVIGLPLPFVSYGGSALVVNLIMLGIVANIYRTRKNYI
jgi:rod shape determining protein RodA